MLGMIAQLLDPSNYTFSIYAVPTFLTTVAILLLGLIVLVRERTSPVSISFFVLTAMVSIWLFCFSWTYSSTNEQVAFTWTRLAYLGVPFIAPATYQFTVSMLRLGRGYKRLARAGWVFAAFFAGLALFTETLLDGMYLYPWGYYTHFGWMGVPFLIFFFGLLIMSMVNYWIEYKKAPPGTHKMRIRWLMTAFGIGYVGSIDYVAVFGIPLYPCGYAAILGFMVVAARAIWKYHLVDITPAFAANQIVQTMTDALLVFDREGIVRVANRAACELFGHSQVELVGKAITETLSDREFAVRLSEIVSSDMSSDGGGANHEMEYIAGDLVSKRILSISTSTMDDKPGRQVAVLCIAHDITEQRRSQDRIQRQLERLAALRSIDTAITSGHDLRVNLGIILDHVTAQLHVDAAAVLLLNPHTQVLEYGSGRGFRSNAIVRSRVRPGEGYAGRAALERRTLYVPQLSRYVETPRPSESSKVIDPAVRPLFTGEEIVAYYALPLIAKDQVKGVLEIFNRSPLEPTGEWVDFAEALAGQTAIAVDNAYLFDDLQRSNMELMLAYDTTLEGWSSALDLRDEETEGHTQRVTAIAERLARAMGQSDADLVHLRRGALLHDIGKMGVPDSILLKPGPLTEPEWEIMRRHPVYAYELLSPISFLRPSLDIPYCHHEKWDGSGYPRGLRGEQIPLAARIFAVVDVWDALRSDRPYRKAWPDYKVREHLRSLAGTHFDPKVVEAFLKTESLASGPISPLELTFNSPGPAVRRGAQARESLS